MKKIFALFGAVFLLTNCSLFGEEYIEYGEFIVSPANNDFQLIKEEEITEEMIEPDERHFVSANETAYFFKKYILKTYERQGFYASSNGMVKGGAYPINLKDETWYEKMGVINIYGTNYTLINPEGKTFLLIAPDGTISPYIARKDKDNEDILKVRHTKLHFYPEDLKIEIRKDIKQEKSNPFIGMEIIFKGRLNGSYAFAFKDFDASGKEEYKYVDFNEAYDIVDFQNVKLKILSVSDNRLEYSLIEKD